MNTGGHRDPLVLKFPNRRKDQGPTPKRVAVAARCGGLRIELICPRCKRLHTVQRVA